MSDLCCLSAWLPPSAHLSRHPRHDSIQQNTRIIMLPVCHSTGVWYNTPLTSAWIGHNLNYFVFSFRGGFRHVQHVRPKRDPTKGDPENVGQQCDIFWSPCTAVALSRPCSPFYCAPPSNCGVCCANSAQSHCSSVPTLCSSDYSYSVRPQQAAVTRSIITADCRALSTGKK